MFCVLFIDFISFSYWKIDIISPPRPSSLSQCWFVRGVFSILTRNDMKTLKIFRKCPPACLLWEPLFWARLDQWKHGRLRGSKSAPASLEKLCFLRYFASKNRLFIYFVLFSYWKIDTISRPRRSPLSQCWFLRGARALGCSTLRKNFNIERGEARSKSNIEEEGAIFQ